MRRALAAPAPRRGGASFETWEGRATGRRALRVAIGRAFFGGIHVSRDTMRSKVALVDLVATLRARRLPDDRTASSAPPLAASLGEREITRRRFLRRNLAALVKL